MSEPEWHDEVGDLKHSLRLLRNFLRDIRSGIAREVQAHRDRRADDATESED